MAFFYLLHYNADTFTKGTHNKRTNNTSVRNILTFTNLFEDI